MLGFWRTNSTKHTKILHSENFVLTNMNIVCYSLCMDFGLRQNARRTEKKMWHSRLKEQRAEAAAWERESFILSSCRSALFLCTGGGSGAAGLLIAMNPADG